MDSLTVSMAGVQRRKREMVEGLHQMHVARTVASGLESIMGEGSFVAPKTVEVGLNDGGTRRVEGPQLAGREDPDVGAALLELFHDEGIDVLLATTIAQVEGRAGDKVRVHAKGENGERTIEGTDLLVATGRMANTDGIGLEQAGVELDERGYIKVNERLETTAANVWAMGDCAGSPQFTHAAYNDFLIVHANLNGGNRTTKNRLVPFCMYTDPELVRVGRNESEARRGGIDYHLAKMPMADVLRTRTVSEPRGFMKMLIGKDNDEILGFTGFGVEASELMAAVQTAMVGRMPFTMLGDAIFTHPTISEGLVFLLGQVKSSSSADGMSTRQSS
jgi:pyruvate/2-oxoglutarate dehydrogenase complex dihydrolipoamide dehydrogenase (E3) component